MLIRWVALVAGMAVLGVGCKGPSHRTDVLEGFAQTGSRLSWPKGALKAGYTAPKNWETERTDPEKRLLFLYYEYDSPTATRRRRREVRDELAFGMMDLIKHYHEGTEDDVYEVVASLSTLFDAMGLAANAVGAVVSSASEAMNAVAGGLLGVRESLNNNFLAQQTKNAVIAEMSALRMTKEAEIRTRLKETDDASYRWPEVRNDLYDFFIAGSVKDAVNALDQKAKEAKDVAEKQLKEARAAVVTSDVATVLASAEARRDRAAAASVRARELGNRRQEAEADALAENLSSLAERLGTLQETIESEEMSLTVGEQVLAMRQAELTWAERRAELERARAASRPAQELKDLQDEVDDARTHARRLGSSTRDAPSVEAAQVIVFRTEAAVSAQDQILSRLQARLRIQQAELDRLTAELEVMQ